MTGGAIYIHGGLRPPEEEFRNLQNQLSDPVVILDEKAVYVGDISQPSTGTQIDIFIVPNVPSPRLSLKDVGMVTTEDIPANSQGYWLMEPKVLDEDRNIKTAAATKDSRNSKFFAHKCVSWKDIDLELDEGGAVMIRLKWHGAPAELRGLCITCTIEKGVG